MTNFADCVEAHVIGIYMSEDSKDLNISMRRQGEGHFLLRAQGVDRFVANEFREQNIVDRINVWNERSASEDFRDVLAELLSGERKDAIDGAFIPLIDREIAAISRGEKVLVEIEPVYGVWAVILTQRIALENS